MTQSTAELLIRSEFCRDPHPEELALFELTDGTGFTLFEANSHVMTAHYKYYLLSNYAVSGNDDGEKEPATTLVLVKAKKTLHDGEEDEGGNMYARPSGGFQRSYFLCEVKS